jgi:hypothetical protein
MKICFDFICDEALIFSSVASVLEKKNYKVTGITLGSRWQEGWRDKFETNSLDLYDKDIDWEKHLIRLSQEYPEDNISSFTQSDRFICNLDRLTQKKLLVWNFLKIEELVVNKSVDVFITTGVAYLYNLVILSVAKRYGIHAISLYGTRQRESRFTVSFYKGGAWELVNAEFTNLQNKGWQEANFFNELNYIKDFNKRAISPDYMKSARQHGGLDFVFFKEFLLRFSKWYFKGGAARTDYITQHPFWYVKRDVTRIFYKRYLDFSFSFDVVPVSLDYYIYPLHLQPEASTLILGADYVNQLETIKAIARRLPPNTVLLVKEHPAAYGRHKIAFYREIKKLFNVRLISPKENVRHLILRSKGVIVVSGTMGWEALLLGKPAIVLGSVFYENFFGVFKVTCLNQLDEVLNKGLKGPDKNMVAVSLKALELGSFPGSFDVHKLDTKETVLSDTNLDNISTGIQYFIKGLN